MRDGTLILCDIGNSTFHFYETKSKKEFKIYVDDKLPLFLKGDIFFISVNKKATKKFKRAYPHAVNLKSLINFKTRYSGMGIDRKFACNYIDDGVIVDAGSAITVDIMEKGKHKGGFILPGLQALHLAYANISKKLDTGFNKKVKLDKLPASTKDALSYAILRSIVLPINDIAKGKKVIVTGGDGEFLTFFLKNAKYRNNIIFESMERVIDANDRTAKR